MVAGPGLEWEREADLGAGRNESGEVGRERAAEGELGVRARKGRVELVAHRERFGQGRDRVIGKGSPALDGGEHGRGVEAREQTGEIDPAVEAQVRLEPLERRAARGIPGTLRRDRVELGGIEVDERMVALEA